MHAQFPEGEVAIVSALRRAGLVSIDDSGPQQLVAKASGLSGETFTKVPRLQGHGLSAHPPSGSDGVYLALGGRSDRLVLIGGEHQQYRQRDLPEGATVLYDHKGNRVYLKTDDGIQIHAEQGKVYVRPGAGAKVYLGGTGDDGSYSPVVTEAGPSLNVYARV